MSSQFLHLHDRRHREEFKPSGQQFVSCKEVAAYLQSFFGPYGARQVMDHAGDNTQRVHRVASESYAGATRKDDVQGQSSEHEKAVALLRIDNLELAGVPMHDFFECHKCNMTFDEKNTYLQHLLSFTRGTQGVIDLVFRESDIECGMIDESQELELYQQQSDHMIDKGIGMIDDASNVLDVALDSSFAIEQHGNTSKALGGTYCLAVFTDEVENSVIEQERGSECCSPAPMSDQKLCSIENDVNLVGTDKQENCETDKVDKTSSVEVEIGIVSMIGMQIMILCQKLCSNLSRKVVDFSMGFHSHLYPYCNNPGVFQHPV
ncbi:hypothetical protein GH714_027253 [Hevea brasiliensis]|uniref:Uncharacterized protein n=1 Tax=Hevea brasiliensis TaxID=3981 RepID=A0A6A6N4W7_HEVBR|nr:hypothetical protein GH714_027253 [Hevea brasiliensis]